MITDTLVHVGGGAVDVGRGHEDKDVRAEVGFNPGRAAVHANGTGVC